jgi:hypothetical protein
VIENPIFSERTCPLFKTQHTFEQYQQLHGLAIFNGHCRSARWKIKSLRTTANRVRERKHYNLFIGKINTKYGLNLTFVGP